MCFEQFWLSLNGWCVILCISTNQPFIFHSLAQCVIWTWKQILITVQFHIMSLPLHTNHCLKEKKKTRKNNNTLFLSWYVQVTDCFNQSADHYKWRTGHCLTVLHIQTDEVVGTSTLIDKNQSHSLFSLRVSCFEQCLHNPFKSTLEVLNLISLRKPVFFLENFSLSTVRQYC